MESWLTVPNITMAICGLVTSGIIYQRMLSATTVNAEAILKEKVDRKEEDAKLALRIEERMNTATVATKEAEQRLSSKVDELARSREIHDNQAAENMRDLAKTVAQLASNVSSLTGTVNTFIGEIRNTHSK